MIVPYATDKTDNFIGYGAVGIMVACVLAFLLSWPVHSRIEERVGNDSLRVWQEQALRSSDAPSDTLDPGPGDASDPFLNEARKAMKQVEAMKASMTSSPLHDSLMRKAHAAIARESPLYRFGFHPAGGRWIPGILTHQFLHGGWMHLLGNMVFFFAFGVAIERRFGLKLFLALYLGGGAFAALCQVGADTGLHRHLPDSTLIGASGSIAVAMGAFLRSWPRARVKVFVWLFRPRLGQIPAWVFLGMWVVMEFLRGHFLMPHQEGGGTAYMAHVSGFLFGFVVAPFLPVTEDAREQDEADARRKASVRLTTWEEANTPARAPFALPGMPPPVAPSAAPTLPERPSTTLADQAWDALERGQEPEAIEAFQKQFQIWLRGGRAEFDLLAGTVLRLRDKRPTLEIAPLVLYECGTRLARSEPHAAAARVCLEKVEESLTELPESMLARCRTLLESLPEPEAPRTLQPPLVAGFAPLPPTFAPSVPPLQAPTPLVVPRPGATPAKPSGNGDRPSWLID